MKKIALAVFDMAGTTVDEDNVVYKTVQKVINEQGFNVTLDEVLKYGAGKEKHQAIIDVLSACTTEQEVEQIAMRAFQNFKVSLEKAYETLEVKTFPGVRELIDELRRRKISIVLNTGYNRKIASGLLQKLDWKTGRDIDGLITADDVKRGRPHPDMIYKAMALCEIKEPKEVLKAGDSVIDIQEGKNAGCGLSVGVLSGAQTEAQLREASPDYIIDAVADLGKILF